MKLWKFWPAMLLLVLTPAAFFFHPDAVVTPFLRAKGFKTLTMLLISGLVGTVEMVLWYIGWGGIRNLIARWFEEDINFVKKIAGEMKKDGYLDWIKVYIVQKYKKLNDRADKLMSGLKVGGYLGFFGLGFWPILGPRMVGDFICGTTKWKGGLIVLCIGNVIKTACLIFAWNEIFSFFGW